MKLLWVAFPGRLAVTGQVTYVILLRYHMESEAVNPMIPALYPPGIPRSQPAGDFAERFAAIRKEKGLTQQQLSERVGVHVQQLKRYEAGSSQPTLDVIRNLAVALGTSADRLLFGKDERGPDEELKLQFEAVSRLDPEEKKVIRSVIESIILRNTMKEASRRFSGGSR